MSRELLKTAAATVAFGVLHSALASRTAKNAAARLCGERRRDGLYRFFFNTQSVASTGALFTYIARQPGLELYRARGPARIAMHAGQLAALAMLTAAVREVGFTRMTGVNGLQALRRSAPVPTPIEAQGPAPDANGTLRTGGPFRYCRHPLNFWGLPVIWLYPRMTEGLLGFNLVATAYLIYGSTREERRLLAAYGDEYRRYLHEGVPFFVPRVPNAVLPSKASALIAERQRDHERDSQRAEIGR